MFIGLESSHIKQKAAAVQTRQQDMYNIMCDTKHDTDVVGYVQCKCDASDRNDNDNASTINSNRSMHVIIPTCNEHLKKV